MNRDLAPLTRQARALRAALGELDWQGTWWPHPGSITATGEIVGMYRYGGHVSLITSGTVWLSAKRLAVAERFGWQRVGNGPGGVLVQVRR